ncbi:hypothetical protein [Burkholderia stagnalis]|uniref:hypothetical protein n=1 Tax=Burkholderia stagnalis TaxID=1503054 RepID=UPI000ADD8746|nr:hypothetical protein [Burkholderia stagnalis]
MQQAKAAIFGGPFSRAYGIVKIAFGCNANSINAHDPLTERIAPPNSALVEKHAKPAPNRSVLRIGRGSRVKASLLHRIHRSVPP